MARSTGSKNYDVRVVGTSAEVRMALARTWASAVIRKSGVIHKADGSDKRQGLFESEGGPAPRVVENKRVQGVQKADRIYRIRKVAP